MRNQNNHTLYNRYRAQVEQRLRSLVIKKNPVTVYDPIRYVLSSGGKRVRAVLTLLSCSAVGGTILQALDAAAAIEILHNFTLVHDDVMDNADMRRSRMTVHKKWDTNVAILSGDEMIAYAYRSLLKTKTSRLPQVLDVFTDAFVQVCEGQGLDKEFESRSGVILDDYMLMIGKKTARVISASAEIGSIIGGGTNAQAAALRTYGEHLGLAFQIQDDLLDIDGSEQEFGKPIGGDVKEGKKTYLLLRAFERVNGNDKKLLKSLKPGNGISKSTIRRVQSIYQHNGVIDDARKEVERNTLKAQQSLAGFSGKPKEMLMWLSDQLLRRNS